MRWLVSVDGQVSGPMDEAMVATLVNAGPITNNAMLREENGVGWVRLSKTPFAPPAAFSAAELAATRPPSVSPMRVVAFLIAGAVAYFVWFGVPRSLLGPPPQVYVECVGAVSGVNCTIDHRGGSSALHACWDVTFTCVGASPIVGHSCGDVSPGAKTSVVMPLAGFPNLEKCQVGGSKVENMVVTELH